MPTIRIDRFRGLAPRFDRRQIPPGAAQIARNIRFDAGDLKPFQGLLPLGLVLGGPSDTMGTMFHYRRGQRERLIPFGQRFRVTGGRSPVPDDQYHRFYFNIAGADAGAANGLFAISMTPGSGANDFIPEPNGSPVGSGDAYRPFAGYRVGVPAPQNAPAATATEAGLGEVGPDADVTITTIAQGSPTTINTSDEPPFRAGQRVRFSIDPDHPRPEEDEGGDEPPPENGDGSADGSIWVLDEQEGVIANVGPSSFDILGVDSGDLPTFTEDDVQALTIRRTLTDQDLESRAYVFTYVTERDEEGPPSPPSNIVDVLKDGVVELEIGDSTPSASVGGSRATVDRIRVYRTVAGETATLYVLVGTLNYVGGASPDSSLEWIEEPTAATPGLPWSGTVLDSVPAVELGEPLPSRGWFPPPPDMEGILLLPNGIIAGWRGNTLYFSEPYLPHAWDPDNRLSLTEEAVGAESFGNTIVVGTRGRPYIVTGIDPSSMRAEKLPDHAPLLNPRAIADAGVGVIYASDNGLMLIGSGGARLLTRGWTKETWLPAATPRDQLLFFDGYAMLFAAGMDPLVLSMVGEDAEASFLDIDISAGARRNNSLALVTANPQGNYRVVQAFNEDNDDGAPLRKTAVFRSGLVTFHRPCNAAVAQLLADGYPLTLTVRAIRPPSYPEPPAGQPDLDVLREMTYEVKGPEPFRLVAGYVSREYEIEIESSHRVQRLILATDMDEMRAQP